MSMWPSIERLNLLEHLDFTESGRMYTEANYGNDAHILPLHSTRNSEKLILIYNLIYFEKSCDTLT